MMSFLSFLSTSFQQIPLLAVTGMRDCFLSNSKVRGTSSIIRFLLMFVSLYGLLQFVCISLMKLKHQLFIKCPKTMRLMHLFTCSV